MRALVAKLSTCGVQDDDRSKLYSKCVCISSPNQAVSVMVNALVHTGKSEDRVLFGKVNVMSTSTSTHKVYKLSVYIP